LLSRGSYFEIGRRVSAKIFPKWLLTLGKSYQLSFSGDKSALIDRRLPQYKRYRDYVFRRATVDDLPRIMECRGNSRHLELYRNFLSQGQICYVLIRKDFVVGYAWVFFDQYVVTYDHYKRSNIRIFFDKDNVFFGNGFVAPAHRMRGIWPLLLSEIIQDLTTNYGVQRCLGTVPEPNLNSLRSHLGLGFEHIQTYYYVYCLGIALLVISVKNGRSRMRLLRSSTKIDV